MVPLLGGGAGAGAGADFVGGVDFGVVVFDELEVEEVVLWLAFGAALAGAIFRFVAEDVTEPEFELAFAVRVVDVVDTAPRFDAFGLWVAVLVVPATRFPELTGGGGAVIVANGTAGAACGICTARVGRAWMPIAAISASTALADSPVVRTFALRAGRMRLRFALGELVMR